MSSAGPGRREVAHRIFAAEYDDATLEYAESDEERAPNYVVTPSGTRINRLFVVGVLTAVEQVNEDTVRARIADPTGAFVVYAGQYQPDELAALQSLEAPAFVAVTGKANTFSPEGSDRVLTSVRPESVTEVDAETRDRWVTATAEHTLARIQTTASALAKDERGEALRAALLRDGVEPGFAEGIARALDHYDTTADYLGALRDLAIQSLEVVAGERSEVEALELDPDAGDGTATAADLADLLGEDRRAVTRAAGDVNVDALVGEDDGAETSESEPESTESVEEEPADGAAADQEPPDQETADADTDSSETVATTADEAAESSSDDAEAQPAEDDEATSGPEPETSEAAVAETAAEAEEAAEAKESESEGPGDEETGAAEATSEPEPETSETAAEETAEDAERAANDEIYEFDEEEREQIEEEHGVEFQSGTEVDPAGEADIETEDAQPDAEADDGGSPEESDPVSESEAEEANEGEEEASADDDVEESADESEDTGEDAEDDVDLEAVLVDEMDALDDGDGADREALIDAVADETGADADAIDDAIDDLLMSGQCYEPSEGTLKPI